MPGFDFVFSIFPLFFFVTFFLVFGFIFFGLVKSVKQWNKDNHSPRIRVAAKVVSKRQSFRRSSGDHHHTSTTYYVTFEVESGDRMELHLAGPEYGMLVEGDEGFLTFQGTRYLSFERQSGVFRRDSYDEMFGQQ